MVTASGTNDLHGGAYEFFRNDIFNANNYFNKNIIGNPSARHCGTTILASRLGGPVVIPHLYNGKDKTFFFYSQEFRRVVQYATATAYVPTDRGNVRATSPRAASRRLPVAVCTSAVAGACASGSSYASQLVHFLAHGAGVYQRCIWQGSTAK